MKSCIGTFSFIVVAILFGVTTAAAVVNPSWPTGNQCRNPLKRHEWRTLSNSQKHSYINAVLCLMKKPAIAHKKFPASVTRFDDFHGIHISQTDYIHFVGQFLSWHRYFLWTYEKALREECGYEGAQPYWDWSIDTQTHGFNNSVIFDPNTGFGGNGPYVNCTDPLYCIAGGTGGGCITDGPFKNHVIHMGPENSTARVNRCLKRDFHLNYPAKFFTAEAMATTMNKPTYATFWPSLEGTFQSLEEVGQHGSGHVGVGAEMVDGYSSPADPLFYMHHAQLDRMWALWQAVDPSKRTHEIAGPTLNPLNPGAPNTTLDYELDITPIAKVVKIRDVMDIRGGTVCYGYF